MNQKIPLKLLVLAAGLALGASVAAEAQTAPPSSDNLQYGLLGSTYVGGFAGYLRPDGGPGAPNVVHEFGAVYNQNVMTGLDLNLTYDDQQAHWGGGHPRSDEALAGFTSYVPLATWFRPYFSGQVGVDWQQTVAYLPAAGRYNTAHDSRFDYVLGAGAEFQVLPALVLTPFGGFQQIQEFSHDWTYGVKATYRLARHWSVSFSPQIQQFHAVNFDQSHGLGYIAGVNYHF